MGTRTGALRSGWIRIGPIVLALASICQSLVSGAACPDFAAAVNYSAGTRPDSVAVGDLNGDGQADLAVANYGSDNVSILLGIGDGTFAAAVDYSAGTGPSSIAVADLNGDGEPDLATANTGSNDVSILLGDGSGALAAPVSYSLGTASRPQSVAIGDFNADGKPDLAVAAQILPNSGAVCVLLGNGDGTFGPSAVRNLGFFSVPTAVALGDFNSDGKVDLAVSAIVQVTPVRGNVFILPGNGNGTFGDADSRLLSRPADSLAVGDFNSDTKPDLAVTNREDVAVLMGVGDGTFAAVGNYGVGNFCRSVAIADVNGDGKPDLVLANSGANDVSILLGMGNGSFDAAPGAAAGTGPTSVAIGDFNGDGKPDVAAGNDGSNDVSILLNGGFCATACGTFTRVDYVAVNNPESVAMADVNGDGKRDLAVAGLNGVGILLGHGDGSFEAADVYAAGLALLG
jgi:hypothetical protein